MNVTKETEARIRVKIKFKKTPDLKQYETDKRPIPVIVIVRTSTACNIVIWPFLSFSCCVDNGSSRLPTLMSVSLFKREALIVSDVAVI